MRLFGPIRRRRPKPKPIVLQRDWPANPGFPGHLDVEKHNRRRLILYFEMTAVFGLIIYLSVFSPLFLITDVQIEASPSLLAKGAGESVNQFMGRSAWGIVPHANYLWLKPSTLIQSIERSMKDITSFDRIVITKHFPSGLTVTLTERSARYVWLSDRGSFGLDDQGIIVSHFNDASTNPDNLRVITDDNNIPVVIGHRVLQAETITALTDFISGLLLQNINIESIVVPALTCPKPINSNLNTNGSDDRGDSVNNNLTANHNINSIAFEADLSSNCDTSSLVVSSQDFRIDTSDGWQILFLANADTSTQLNKLKRFLQDGSTALKTLSYVDLRFGERIYFK